MISRVRKGPDKGDYTPRPTDYGETFWHGPNPVPVSHATMTRWLTSGKATLLEPCQRSPSVPSDLTPRSLGEANWLAEVATWNRAERFAVLRLAGCLVPPDATKNHLAGLLLALRREIHGTPSMPETPPRGIDLSTEVREILAGVTRRKSHGNT